MHNPAEYKEKMSTDSWRERRMRALRRVGHQCQHVMNKPEYTRDGVRCGGRSPGLHIHHLIYDDDRFGGNEADSDILVLCPRHHGAYELMKLRCTWCETASVFDNIADALALWDKLAKLGQKWEKHLDNARSKAPSLCPRCAKLLADN